MEYNKHSFNFTKGKVAEKAKLKITIIENFSENFEKPPKEIS